MGTTTYGLDVAKSPEIASTWLKLTPKNKARAFSHSLGQERTPSHISGLTRKGTLEASAVPGAPTL